ncbi:MAG: LptF/LptG family permease [candidate division Zixibacteria bacterium]|nr:LptF/LptG family permease [candidate division Zixibacteria bacterium]
MKILSGYILKEHTGPFFFGLAVIIFVLVMDFILEILNLIITRGLDILTVLQMFALNMAWMLALAIPMAVLVATLMAFGRMSADNEITALRAGGVSLYKIVTPVVIGSILLGIGLVFFNNLVLPDANHRARLLMTEIHQKRPTLNLKENVFINDLPGYNILIRKVDPRSSRIEDVRIYDQKNRVLPRTIIAKRGNVEFSTDGGTLILELFDGEVHEPDEKDPTLYRRVAFDKQVLFIGDVSPKLTRTDDDFRTDREMSVRQMKKEVADLEKQLTPQKEQIQKLEARIADTPDLSLKKSIKEFTASERTEFHRLQSWRRQIDQARQMYLGNRKRIDAYQVEIYKKYSIPAACLVFVLVGAPLGIMARRGGLVMGLGLSLGFFVLYWAFLIAGEELADRQLITPFWAMWSADILVGATGLYLLIRTAREARFISWNWLEKFVPARLRKFLK